MTKKRIALVTGASRGIGKSIAIALGKSNHFVVGTDIDDQGLKDIKQIFDTTGIDGAAIKLDVGVDDEVETVVKTINDDYGAVSILVNNAGITKDNLLMRMKDNEWHDLLNVNLTSVFRMSRACLRGMMKARFGRIISIASVVGATGNAGQTNYAAAKAGIMGFSKSLAREVGTRGITVNTIAPGFIDTKMTQGLSQDQKAALKQQIPLAELGKPEDIANAVDFLASDKASYITGQTLHVNGGMYM